MKSQHCFSVIGAGNLGCHLIRSLLTTGYTLKYIFQKAKCRCFDNFLEQDLALFIRESDIIFICTQESRIREVAERIAAVSNPEGKYFFHTSNSLTSDELISLKSKGAYTASFSPLQTFACFDECGEGIENIDRDNFCEDLFTGIYFQVEGDEPAVTAACAIAADLGARVVKVDKGDKIYFHIAAVCASNFTVGLLKMAEMQLGKSKGKGGDSDAIDINVLMPLVRQTVKNIGKNGVDASLTGPFKRGETAIIDKHLAHLSGDEGQLYQTMTAFLKNLL